MLGDRLGHVKDFSREDPLAWAYRNKQELSPHTDSADLVWLFCLRDAQSGGVSRLPARPRCRTMAEGRWTPCYETYPVYESPLPEFSKDR